MKAVILDLDGTLIDTIGGIAYAANKAIAKFGFEPLDRAFYVKAIGNGAKALIERAVGGSDKNPELNPIVLADFLDEYTRNWQIDLSIYPGMEDLVKTLNQKGVKVAINTNKPNDIAQKIVRSFFSEELIFEIVGSQKLFPNKPDPTGVWETLKHIGAKPEDCFYVGDSNVDIQTARNAGIPSIAVTWGYGNPEELTGYDYKVNSAKEIEAIVLR